MSTATRPMTAEEFFEFVLRPENADRMFELDEGKVVEVSPPPRSRHGVVCSNVAYLLGAYVRERGRGFLFTNDSGLVVSRGPDTVRAPDIALFDDERSLDDLDRDRGYEEEPPLLAVEVLSPSDRSGAVLRKVNQYLRGDVKMVWVVDPVEKSVSVHRPESEPIVFDIDDTLSDADLLPGFSCPIIKFFRVHVVNDGE